MSINVKRVNRVRVHSQSGVKLLEQFNAATRKPAFRQNGYEVDGFTKKPFALGFDSANSDDLIIPNSTVWSTWGDVNYEFITDVSNVGNTENLISFGDSVGDKFRLTRWTTGVFRGQVTINSVTNDFQIAWDDSWQVITIRQTAGIIYVNNVQALDFSARNAESLFSFNDFHFGRLSYTPIWYTNQTLFSIDLGGETFKLTEGLGNEVFGSSGTVGGIFTSAADANERINFGMWLKGNDVDGWTPYT